MGAAIGLTWLALASGCSKGDEGPKVRATNAASSESFEVSRLDGYRVQELLIVVFARDYTPAEWTRIFDWTRALSANKRRLRSIEGALDAEADRLRGELIERNADLLTELGSRSLFILSWSANDENCRFAADGATAATAMTCKPRSLDNPLNGGLPQPDGAVEWIRPNPVTSDIKTPYLRLALQRVGEPAFRLELRLKTERVSEREGWFKGEAVPAPGSRFIDFEGVAREPGFPYGYAEMTVTR